MLQQTRIINPHEIIDNLLVDYQDTWEDFCKEVIIHIVGAELYTDPKIAAENQRRYDKMEELDPRHYSPLHNR